MGAAESGPKTECWEDGQMRATGGHWADKQAGRGEGDERERDGNRGSAKGGLGDI